MFMKEKGGSEEFPLGMFSVMSFSFGGFEINVLDFGVAEFTKLFTVELFITPKQMPYLLKEDWHILSDTWEICWFTVLQTVMRR